jgi:hypothetical protein
VGFGSWEEEEEKKAVVLGLIVRIWAGLEAAEERRRKVAAIDRAGDAIPGKRRKTRGYI